MPIDDNQLSSTPTELQNRELLDNIYVSVERTRKMFLWTLVISVVAFVLPLIGLIFAIPFFVSSYILPVVTQFGL